VPPTSGPRAEVAWQHASYDVTPTVTLAFQTAPAHAFTIARGLNLFRSSRIPPMQHFSAKRPFQFEKKAP
jgi:hypothetical protein